MEHPRPAGNASVGGVAAFLAVGLLAYVGASYLATSSVERTLLVVIGGMAAMLAFLRTEIALHLLIFAMLLSPEIAVGDTAGGTLGRGITLRIDDFLILLISSTWLLKGAIYKNLDLIPRTPLNNAIFLYVAACLIATLLGVVGGQVDLATGGLFVLKYIEYFLVYWMVVNTVTEEQQLNRYLLSLFVVALIVSVIAITQIPSGLRVTAPFEGDNGEPNTLGGYLLFLIALLSGLACGWSRWRSVILPTLLILSIAFVYTLSRASYLGVIPLVVLIPILTRRYMLLPAMALGSLIVLMSPSLVPRAVYDRVTFTFSQAATQSARVEVFGQKLDSSTSARLLMFSDAGQAFLDKPVTGWGVTGWRFIDSQYFRTLVETGLIGMAAFLFLMYRVLVMAVRLRRTIGETRPLYWGLAAGFIAGHAGLLMHAIGSNTFIIVRIMEPFWLTCGLLFVASEVIGRDAGGDVGAASDPALHGVSDQPA